MYRLFTSRYGQWDTRTFGFVSSMLTSMPPSKAANTRNYYDDGARFSARSPRICSNIVLPSSHAEFASRS